MKKTVMALAAAMMFTLVLGGCGGKDDNKSAATNVITQAAPIINISSDYALLPGYTQYQSPDGGFSIQLPERSTVNDSDLNSVTMTIAGAYSNPDTLSVTNSSGAQQIQTVEQLMNMLKADDSIDITAFFVLNRDGAYKGYKYMYESVDNDQLKGIVSTYFADDGSAYTVNATINNGRDDTNFNNINTIVDTFICGK